jgi:hypothetical protein
VKLTAHPHVAPRLRIHGSIPPILHTSICTGAWDGHNWLRIRSNGPFVAFGCNKRAIRDQGITIIPEGTPWTVLCGRNGDTMQCVHKPMLPLCLTRYTVACRTAGQRVTVSRWTGPIWNIVYGPRLVAHLEIIRLKPSFKMQWTLLGSSVVWMWNGFPDFVNSRCLNKQWPIRVEDSNSIQNVRNSFLIAMADWLKRLTPWS